MDVILLAIICIVGVILGVGVGVVGRKVLLAKSEEMLFVERRKSLQ